MRAWVLKKGKKYFSNGEFENVYGSLKEAQLYRTKNQAEEIANDYEQILPVEISEVK